MKKLVAAYCCILCFQSFSKGSISNELTEPKTSGKKELLKAIAVIMNTEANKKQPTRRIFIASSELPLS